MFLAVDVCTGPVLFLLNPSPFPRSKYAVRFGPSLVAANMCLLSSQPFHFAPSELSASNTLTDSLLLIPLPLINICRFGERHAPHQNYTR
jgi:hypothetical protein